MSYIKRWLEDGCPADAEYVRHSEIDEEGIDFARPAVFMFVALLVGLVFGVTFLVIFTHLIV